MGLPGWNGIGKLKRDWVPKKRHCRVAVTGSWRSGKTVLLTSLLNLLDHNKQTGEDFKLESGQASPSYFKLAEASGSDGAFPFEEHRNSLISGRWPDRTTDVTHGKATVRLQGGRFDRVTFSFLDFPGERMGDIPIAQHADFGGWSSETLGYLRSADIGDVAKEYLGLVEGRCEDASALLAAYKKMLVIMFVNRFSYLSPSTFLVDLNGRELDMDDENPEDGRYLGLGPKDGMDGEGSREFAPLPPAYFDKGDQPTPGMSQLAKDFGRHYREYRKTVPLPLFRRVLKSDALAILFDIPEILVKGPRALRGAERMVKDFAKLMDGERWWGRVWGAGCNIRRLATVASKCDLVHDDDANTLLHLLDRLTPSNIERRLDEKTLSVSAIISTKSGNNSASGEERVLLELGHNGAEGGSAHATRALPEKWPATWEPKDYPLVEVCPSFPKSGGPTKHKDLDKLLDFLLGLSETTSSSNGR